MSKVLDRETTERLVREAVEAHPGRINPRGDTGFGGLGCVYTSQSGKSHCIAGQVLADFGFPVPVWGDSLNNDGIGDYVDQLNLAVDSDALKYLEAAQYVFDGSHITGVGKGGSNRMKRRWKDAYRLLNDHYDQVLEELD
jgi:hypothetical protein